MTTQLQEAIERLQRLQHLLAAEPGIAGRILEEIDQLERVVSQPHVQQAQSHIRIIVEKHPDGYVAYALGLRGAAIGEGDTYEEALADAKGAVLEMLETFGPDVIDTDTPVLDAGVEEMGVALP